MKERESFLDKLRVAATCAVVLLHTVTGVMDHTDMGAYPMEKKVFLVILDLVCWCVPIFLMISGYLFLNPDRKLTFGTMLSRYCRRIVLALFVFGVPYACLEQIAAERSFRWGMAGNAFLMVVRGESWSHMWYLYLILILYLLTPALRKLLAVLPRMALYGLLAVLFIGSSILPYLVKLAGLEEVPALPDWGIYIFYYISGSLFYRKKYILLKTETENHSMTKAESEKDSIKKTEAESDSMTKAGTEKVETKNPAGKDGKEEKLWLVLAALLATAMVCSRLPGNYIVQMAYNYPFTVVLSLLLFAGGKSISLTAIRKGTKENAAWKQAAGLSFTVYLVHPVFLNIAYKFLHVTPLSFPIGISLPVFFGLTLALAVASALVLHKIPLLKKYVL